MNIFEIILWLGVFQGAFLSFILITHKSNQPANRVLGIAVFFLSLELFYLVIVKTGIFNNFIFLMGLFFSLLFIYVPMIYLYVLMLTNGLPNFKNVFYHFIPLLLNLIVFVFIYLKGSDERNLILFNIHNGDYFYARILNSIKPFYGVFYIVLILRLIKQHNKKLKNSFSNLDKINLAWLRNLSFVLIFITIIVVVQNISEFMYNETSALQYLLFISMAAFIYLIGYFGLKQPEIFSQAGNEIKEEVNELKTNDKSQLPKYGKSGLNNETADEYLERLKKYMDENKPYLRGNITLHQLAGNISISPHNLSEVINTRMNMNFYDFINSYKVKEVKDLITKDKEMKFSILALGYEAGFSSKSSFYSAFKKETGITPAQFRKEILGDK